MAEPHSPPALTPLNLSWVHPKGLIGLSLINTLLRILTLGIYGFWARTEVRKRIWSGIRLNGEPLVYTGTGKELFLGFLFVFFVVLIPAFLLVFGAVFAFGPESGAAALVQLALYLAFLMLWGVAIYRAFRYRLSRTNWRGIRGSLVGNSQSYGWTWFWTALLVPLSLGWIIPWRSVKLQEMMTRDMRFGSRPFRFSATAAPLYTRFGAAWILTMLALAVPVLLFATYWPADLPVEEGAELTPEQAEALTAALLMVVAAGVTAYLIFAVATAWYRAYETNYFAAATTFEGARFKGTLAAGGLIWIAITNFLIVVFSLGILTPVAQARATRYLVDHLEIEGAVPLGEIAQGPDQNIVRGEGLAQAFEIDAI